MLSFASMQVADDRMTNDTRLIPIKSWGKFHEWPTVYGLRNLIAKREANGLQEAGAIIRLGKRIVIDESRFIAWARARGGAR